MKVKQMNIGLFSGIKIQINKTMKNIMESYIVDVIQSMG